MACLRVESFARVVRPRAALEAGSGGVGGGYVEGFGRGRYASSNAYTYALFVV